MPSAVSSPKTAVVCGASQGLGRDFARVLAAEGLSHLGLISRSVDGLWKLRDELQAAYPGLHVLCLAADLRSKEQLQNAAQQIHSQLGSVDLLIQAVGQSDRGRVVDLSAGKLQDLIEVNVLTSLHALQCFEPMLTQPGGCVVLIGSLASKFAPRFLGGYAIAKHGLAALAQQARLEWADQGLHVLLACPGPLARQDAGTRYDHLAGDTALPPAARQPGGGAKVTGLDAAQFVRDVLKGARQRQPQIIRPKKAEWLLWISAVSCRWGDRLLRKNSG
jgi:short-subunit dehydrogenase